MPPSGWYDDPEQPWTWRYWDGARWTEHRSPMWVPPVRDPRSISAWFERGTAAVKLAVRRIGLLLMAVWLILGVLGWWLLVTIADGDRGRELRRLLDIDQNFGLTGSSASVELSEAEADRAWELFRELFWSAVPWLIVLGLLVVLASAWSVALVARTVHGPLDEPSAGNLETADPLANVAGDAMRRVPAVFASGVVVLLVFAGVWLVAGLPMALVVVAGGGGAAIVLTVVFVVLVVMVVTAWLWARLTLASVIAAVGGHGLGVRRSWDITDGRFWFVVGRLLITGLIAGVVSSAANVFNTFGQFLGLAAYLAIVFFFQAVAVAASMIVTVCGHLVTIDQVDDGQQASN